MPSVQTGKPPATFEEIWAILERNAEGMKEIKEIQARTAQQMEEYNKEYNRRFGNLTNRFGEVVEYMIAPNLCDKFEEYNRVVRKPQFPNNFLIKIAFLQTST
jgi:hypothetical protein